MKLFRRIIPWCVVAIFLPAGVQAGTNTSVHTTWLWHLHQPIYWPDRRNYGADHYENAWDTIQQQNAGRPHPSPEVLSTIFAEADRVNAYQGQPSSTISGLLGYPNAGAQVNYSGALEGTLDLAAAFGSVPTNLYLCAAAYQTADGGALVAQCPPGSGPNIDTNEFLVIPVVALRDSLGNGTFDLCDPARGFKILSANSSTNGCMLNWAAMPGRAYQVQFASRLGGTWSHLPAGSNYVGSLQMQLNYTESPSMTATQRFYRIELLP